MVGRELDTFGNVNFIDSVSSEVEFMRAEYREDCPKQQRILFGRLHPKQTECLRICKVHHGISDVLFYINRANTNAANAARPPTNTLCCALRSRGVLVNCPLIKPKTPSANRVTTAESGSATFTE